MLNPFSVLSDWSGQNLGNGINIRIGNNPMVGDTFFFQLPHDLLNAIHDKTIFFYIKWVMMMVLVIGVKARKKVQNWIFKGI